MISAVLVVDMALLRGYRGKPDSRLIEDIAASPAISDRFIFIRIDLSKTSMVLARVNGPIKENGT